MNRGSKDKPLSKKEERLNKKLRKGYNIHPKDIAYKTVIDNASNTHLGLTERLIEKRLVPEDIKTFAKEISVNTEICVMNVLHKDTAKYKALVMRIGRKLKKLYKDLIKKHPNLVNVRGHYKNRYDELFYETHGDNVLYSYKDKFDELNYEEMRHFYYDRSNRKGWYDYRLFKKK